MTTDPATEALSRMFMTALYNIYDEEILMDLDGYPRPHMTISQYVDDAEHLIVGLKAMGFKVVPDD